MQNRLKQLRSQYQWSQADLARKLGISRQAVNGFESGKFDPSLEMAGKIASLFNVAIEHVFIGEAKNSMQMLSEKVKTFFGFEFGCERFTETAINAINFARNEATRTQSPTVKPEHLLAGLLADPITTSARLLQDEGITLAIEITEHAFAPLEKPALSAESKFVLELALQIVRLRGGKSIDTEHLLWGLVKLAETDKTLTSHLFQQNGIDLVALNNQLAGMV